MKKFFAFLLAGLTLGLFVTACGALPALSFTSTETPLPLPPTETFTPAPPTETPSQTPTETVTPTAIPSLTPTSQVTSTPKPRIPAAPGTPVIDPGFVPLTLDNTAGLQIIFRGLRADLRQVATSRDGQKLFASTSNGLFVFDKTGQLLAHWPEILTTSRPCQQCLAVDAAGSHFALLTRNAGYWEVQVYEVQESQRAVKTLTIPMQATFLGVADEGQLALSPDNLHLAYAVGDVPLRVFNLKTGLQVFTSQAPLHDIQFTVDGSLFVARQERSLLFYNTADWGKPATLLLPGADNPFAISPQKTSLAIIYGSRLRIYTLETLKASREIALTAGKNSQWTLNFPSETTIQGFGLQWNGTHTRAAVTSAEWEVESGKNIRLETVETDSPSAFPPSWNMELPFKENLAPLKAGDYNRFLFLGNELLVINSTHAVCWLKFVTAEQSCVEDPDHVLFSVDTQAYKEIVSETRTQLQSWKGENLLDVGNYRIVALERKGNWMLIDIKGLGTDLYAKNKIFPEESVGGAFQGFTESAKLMAFTTQQKSKTNLITIVEKDSGTTITQAKDVFLYKPLLLKNDGTLYLLKRDLDKNQTIIEAMAPPSYTIKELTRLSLPANVNTLTFSKAEDLLAFGLADGSLVLYNPDFSASFSIQAFDSPVLAIAFSPDGRFLAAASAEGIKMYAVKP